jgi:hypothetical protein
VHLDLRHPTLFAPTPIHPSVLRRDIPHPHPHVKHGLLLRDRAQILPPIIPAIAVAMIHRRTVWTDDYPVHGDKSSVKQRRLRVKGDADASLRRTWTTQAVRKRRLPMSPAVIGIGCGSLLTRSSRGAR